MECSQGVNDVLFQSILIFTTSVFDKRESISRGLMSLYWVSEGVDHEKRLRNGAIQLRRMKANGRMSRKRGRSVQREKRKRKISSFHEGFL